VDTVSDFGEDASGGTGLLCEPNADALGEALGRAIKLFANKSRYGAVQQRGMARDFSWKTAAAAYEALYRDSL
jgi:starch synthase